MRSTKIKGYRVHQDGRGKVTLEPLKFYGRKMDASARIRARNSKRVKVVRQGTLKLNFSGE